jgi:Flp pilus assembly protein TadB
VGLVVAVLALLAFFGLIFTGHVLLAFAALIVALTFGISALRQRQRPPEPGE